MLNFLKSLESPDFKTSENRVSPCVDFVGDRLSLPGANEGALVPVEKLAPPQILEGLMARGPKVVGPFDQQNETAGWHLTVPPAGAMSVGKSETKDRFIVTRLPGNAAEATDVDVSQIPRQSLPKGTFSATQKQWKVALRRMLRANMLRLLVQPLCLSKNIFLQRRLIPGHLL